MGKEFVKRLDAFFEPLEQAMRNAMRHYETECASKTRQLFQEFYARIGDKKASKLTTPITRQLFLDHPTNSFGIAAIADELEALAKALPRAR